MPEMLTPTSKVIGAFGMQTKIGLMTDARFSGGSVGGAPIIGHMEEDGYIRLIRDGDTIIVDPRTNLMQLDVSSPELLDRDAGHTPYVSTEAHIPMPLRHYARGNPDPRTGSLGIEF
jgi:dihydroxyacid dehydratase/phosphogluconate dehydratase